MRRIMLVCTMGLAAVLTLGAQSPADLVLQRQNALLAALKSG